MKLPEVGANFYVAGFRNPVAETSDASTKFELNGIFIVG
jgi:hypothetical protein